MDAMNLPFLDAYLDSVGLPNFHQGCNFAADTTLQQQVHSALAFKYLSSIYSKPEFLNFLQAEDYFQKGLYMFDIGQNDIGGAFNSKDLDQILYLIPTILLEFENGIKRLYDSGAGNFWIHNTGPLGCLAQYVATFGNDLSKLDE
ncbi:GDSL esterase/lipase At1g54790-like isoform X1 [Vicia villosa]|uniref:GDSL esterase/lipase At1g54790-like isoform X1 n=1 Tax=Vicia villosa TaxID=3911 RepID=UPI00273BBEF8|nr:GDSL esterase/lipase At1g54790-like isoform X1 [Vicia villosa]